MKSSYRIMKAVIGLSLIATLFLSATFSTEALFSQDRPTVTPDTRYGKDGTRETTTNADGEVVKIVWKDSQGRVLEEEEYKWNGGEGVRTTYYNPTPTTKKGEKGKLARRVTRRVNKIRIPQPPDYASEEEISFEDQRFDEEEKQNGGTKREGGPDGKPRTYRWEPGKGYVEETTGTTTGQTAARGFDVANEIAGGLNTTIFSTPSGKIRVNLPDDMSAGDTLSGTVIAEPTGKNQNETARNEGELNGYVVEVENRSASAGRILKFAVPAAASAATYLILKDKKGKEVAREEVPVARAVSPIEEFDIPSIGQQGRPVEIRGPFDGDFANTNVKLSGNDLEMLAESPRKVIARNTGGQSGVSEMEVRERDQAAKGEFRTLGVKLSAPKLDLRRGESTTLTLIVSGLEGISEDVPLEIENKSSDVIQMTGGERQMITIKPTQVREGTYTFERPLTGIRRGAFTITGTVVGRGHGPSLVAITLECPDLEAFTIPGGKCSRDKQACEDAARTYVQNNYKCPTPCYLIIKSATCSRTGVCSTSDCPFPFCSQFTQSVNVECIKP